MFYRAPRRRKEAGTMPSAVRGAASPWFTGAGSDLLVTTSELKVPFKLQLTDHGQTTNSDLHRYGTDM